MVSEKGSSEILRCFYTYINIGLRVRLSFTRKQRRSVPDSSAREQHRVVPDHVQVRGDAFQIRFGIMQLVLTRIRAHSSRGRDLKNPDFRGWGRRVQSRVLLTRAPVIRYAKIRLILYRAVPVSSDMRSARKVQLVFIVSKTSAAQCSTGALLCMLRHGGLLYVRSRRRLHAAHVAARTLRRS